MNCVFRTRDSQIQPCAPSQSDWGGPLVAGQSNRIAAAPRNHQKLHTIDLFDTRTGRELLALTPTISNQYGKNRATFSPSDELVLSDGVLWDVNSGKEIHKFDKLNQTHSGVFHPNGLELISNTEVWDLRTFHLLRTVPTLDKSEVIFNPQSSILYALCLDQDSEERDQFDTSFKTLDAYDYSSIATIDVKRNIYSLAVSRWGTQIALVENQGDVDQMQESCVKLYDVGRARDQDDDAGDVDQMQESCVKLYDVGRARDQDDDAVSHHHHHHHHQPGRRGPDAGVVREAVRRGARARPGRRRGESSSSSSAAYSRRASMGRI
ncbi:unnamed protein product [Plutella xylostella]|uniref:(diamondback moth) hypothetical protein n=1 Tax=Plutella xylostella TaxID=51655 RepID=A0A8S4G626_PLUXY|nr:unnamed protein product [Plutella xylostella]